ncbi:MAG: hypothetical protein LBU27_06805 [Candidatus Peribacteria bacterium]|nr:hypothetical protein [Candidatus Peribacteria bacterium]
MITVIISGDGDFHYLIEFLLEKDKLLLLMVPNKKFSGLLKKFFKHIVIIANSCIEKIKQDNKK